MKFFQMTIKAINFVSCILMTVVVSSRAFCESDRASNNPDSSMQADFRWPTSVAWQDQWPQGELRKRLEQSFNRLESDIYDEDHVFRTTDSGDPWPGDTEGRLILGVSVVAQALQLSPRHLPKIIERLPSKFNSLGLLGQVRPPDVFDEQLLASHGWVLRGLSEYYKWTKDPKCAVWLNHMLDSLAVPLTHEIIKRYPIDPSERKHDGGEQGHPNENVNGWKVSSDTGCIFIFFDGLVQASLLLDRKDLQPVVNDLKDVILRFDMAKIQAQTHASLTGLRGLCRLYEASPDANLLAKICDRWALYRDTAMTANGENYNWFGRPTWTEPCAVVDSFLLAVDLWRYTMEPGYLEDAHNIYYNGLSAAQRSNGGFGLNTCAYPGNHVLKMHALEATWCCTMRGGDGLAHAAKYSWFVDDKDVFVTFPREGTAVLRQGNESIKLKQETGYPQQDSSAIIVEEVSPGFHGGIKLFSPSWMLNPRVKLNGKNIATQLDNGFLVVQSKFDKGDRLEWSFTQPIRVKRDDKELVRLYRGPLLLGIKDSDSASLGVDLNELLQYGGALPLKIGEKQLSTVYHLMDEAADREQYKIQVLFKDTEGGNSPAASPVSKRDVAK